MSRLRRKAYVDLDPGFTQFWHADGTGGARLEGHDVHFTVGENIGRPGCADPHLRAGLEGGARRPAVLEEWPVADAGDADRFTTIGAWRGAFGPVRVRRPHLLAQGARVPQGDRAAAPFAAAVRDRARHPSRRRARPRGARGATAGRWSTRARPSPARSSSATTCRDRAQSSRSRRASTWRRTAGGSATARSATWRPGARPWCRTPASARTSPSARGCWPSPTSTGPSQGAERIAADYEHHRRAARAVAEEHFDSDTVLSRFLEEAGIGP